MPPVPRGRQHVCADRYEIGVRNGWPGALAEQLAVPVTALQALPDTVDAALGALVEPGGNALRFGPGVACGPGNGCSYWVPAPSGCSPRRSARAQGAEVHLLGRDRRVDGLRRLHRLRQRVDPRETLPDLPYDAVIDASNAAALPSLAAELVEPGRPGSSTSDSPGEPSLLDTRTLALKDVTAVGVLSASGGIAGTVELYATGAVDPRPLVAATVGLEDVAAVLAGEHRPDRSGAGPKVHVDPRL